MNDRVFYEAINPIEQGSLLTGLTKHHMADSDHMGNFVGTTRATLSGNSEKPVRLALLGVAFSVRSVSSRHQDQPYGRDQGDRHSPYRFPGRRPSDRCVAPEQPTVLGPRMPLSLSPP